MLQVHFWQQASKNTRILNSCNRLWLTESEQNAPVFDKKQLKKAGRHIGRNFVNITIKMMTVVRNLWMIKITELRHRNSDNEAFLYRNEDVWCCAGHLDFTITADNHFFFIISNTIWGGICCSWSTIWLYVDVTWTNILLGMSTWRNG